MIDTGIITHTCPCSSTAWKIDWVQFEDYEISSYSLNMTCFECGTKAVTPCLPDKQQDPFYEKE